MRDCETCKAHNLECGFKDDWESCISCGKNGRCDGFLDLSQIGLLNVEIGRAESELKQLRQRVQQDSQLLVSLGKDVKWKRTALDTALSSETDETWATQIRSEIDQLISEASPVQRRHQSDKLAHQELVQRLEASRSREDTLFQQLVSQVQRRTVNDCAGCITSGEVCDFPDGSEQCIECRRHVRRCEGSLDDDDIDLIKAALKTIDVEIDDILNRKLPDSGLYSSLKEGFKSLRIATIQYRGRSGLSKQEIEERYRIISNFGKSGKELEEFRNSNLIEDTTYQQLRIRKRILDACHNELLGRGVFYYDELEKLTGYPGAEDLDEHEFRQAVEWAAQHPDEHREYSSSIGSSYDQDKGLEDESDAPSDESDAPSDKSGREVELIIRNTRQNVRRLQVRLTDHIGQLSSDSLSGTCLSAPDDVKADLHSIQEGITVLERQLRTLHCSCDELTMLITPAQSATSPEEDDQMVL
jgi:hypothetical protein